MQNFVKPSSVVCLLIIVFFLVWKYQHNSSILKEGFIYPIILTFQEEHVAGISEEHTFVFLEQPFKLDRSFEPKAKGESRRILFGIHHSDLYPKNKSAEECFYYQEKIYIINGFSSLNPEDMYFLSSVEENSFHPLALSYYAFNARDSKVNLRMTQSYHKDSNKELIYSRTHQPLNIACFKLENDRFVIDCIIGAYAHESEIRPELKGTRVFSGFMDHDGRHYLLKGFSKGEGVYQVTAYDYDRRFIQSLPTKTFKISYNGVWTIEEIKC